MKKILSLLLASVLLASAFASCGGDPAVTTGTPASTDAPVATTAANNVPDLPAPDTLDIAGEFHILVSGNYTRNDFHSEGEEGATAVEIAIFRRNELLKGKYGVEIVDEDVTKFGSTTGSGTGFTKIYTDYMAGESNYDAASIGTYDVCTLAYSGYIHDLNDIPYLNLEKDYWDQRANEDLSINGKMFYTNGDIGVVNNKVTHAILFNKNMAEAYGIESPYDIVNNDEWTLSLMTNEEVLDVNQHSHDGKQIYRDEDTIIWSAVSSDNKPLIAVFNVSEKEKEITRKVSEKKKRELNIE